MITLKSDRLLVEIAEPGISPNTTIRFDRAAFITQVTLDGKHTFCTFEPNKPELPRTGGFGICSEIKADTIQDSPVGGQFHKFGVGLFIKPDEEPYSFRRTYQCEPYEVSYSATDTEAVFVTNTPVCFGYALNLRKTVSVSGNTLRIQYEYENTGSKPLVLGEYCHNFITIDNLPLGKEYYLSMNVKNQDGNLPSRGGGSLHGSGNGFTFDDYFDEGTSVIVKSEDVLDGEFFWRLDHKNSEASIMERTSFKPGRMIVWAIDCDVSPEIYNNFTLNPKEKANYWREFVFND
ncbi:MAG: hypothetical protein ACI3VB_07325 [Oscillospiraceae bacterium]